MSAIKGAQQSQNKQSNKIQPPRTTKKGISDAWRHVQAHRGVRVPTRDVRAYRTRSQDPPRVGPRQAGVTSRKRAPKSFYELRKIVSRVLGSRFAPVAWWRGKSKRKWRALVKHLFPPDPFGAPPRPLDVERVELGG